VTLSGDVSWPGLSQTLQNLFKVTSEFSLEYLDPENDHVVIGSAEEWEECLRIGNNYSEVGKPLRLYLKKTKLGKRDRSCSSLSSGLPAFEPTHFYTSTGTTVHDPSLLQGIQAQVPHLLARYLPENWQSNPKMESLPEWLRTAVNFQWDRGDFELDVNVDALANVLSRRALGLMDEKKVVEALALLKDAIGLQPTKEKFYNIACCHALLGEVDLAFEALAEAVSRGYTNAEHMQKDSDLAILRGNERFHALLATITSLQEAPVEVTVSCTEPVPSAPEYQIFSAPTTPLTPMTPTELPCESVTQTPEPVSPVPEVPQSKYPNQINSLQEMGFWDHQANVEVLERTNGNMVQALELLIRT